jgi:hypothetical protein
MFCAKYLLISRIFIALIFIYKAGFIICNFITAGEASLPVFLLFVLERCLPDGHEK